MDLANVACKATMLRVYLGDGVFNPFEEYELNQIISPGRGEHKKYLSCHHLVIHQSQIAINFLCFFGGLGKSPENSKARRCHSGEGAFRPSATPERQFPGLSQIGWGENSGKSKIKWMIVDVF